MTLKIVVDSTSDIPTAVAEELGISVLPVYIHIGEKDYRDGVDMTREDFYTQLANFPEHPKTGAPGPGQFIELWERLADEGASEIISVHIASSLSAVCAAARVAAEQFNRIPVHVFDSGQITLGLGLQAVVAAKMAQAGESVQAILKHLTEMGPRIHVFAALDTMEFLARSGRVSSLVAGLGGFFQLKPILKMHNNVSDSERTRTNKRALTRVAELLQSVSPLEQVALLHANANERLDELCEYLGDLLPDTEIWRVNITPAIGAHVGPGTVGVVGVKKGA